MDTAPIGRSLRQLGVGLKSNNLASLSADVLSSIFLRLVKNLSMLVCFLAAMVVVNNDVVVVESRK